LLDGVSGDEVNQEEDQGDDQPDYWEGVEDALEESSQFSVLSSRFSVKALQNQVESRVFALEVGQLQKPSSFARIDSRGRLSPTHYL
jgi:hypothetical protein